MRRWLVIVALFISVHAAGAGQVSGVPQIVDADTAYVGQTKIRFNGVDAPETDQVCLDAAGKTWTCGIEARERLRSFSKDREWSCELTGTDKYRRSLGSCAVGGENVSRWLVQNGFGRSEQLSSVGPRKDDQAFLRRRMCCHITASSSHAGA